MNCALINHANLIMRYSLTPKRVAQCKGGLVINKIISIRRNQPPFCVFFAQGLTTDLISGKNKSGLLADWEESSDFKTTLSNHWRK